MKSIPSMIFTKSMTEPRLPQEKQTKRFVATRTEKEGLESS
jgi:hypothetical protein